MEVDGCELPEDRLYDLDREVWWKASPDDGTATVGLLSAFAAFAGPFRELSFRPVEGAVREGRSVATVESIRLTAAIRLPVDAEILERNERLRERPRLLNDAPYTDGWIVRVRPRAPLGPNLASAAAVRSALAARIAERTVRCWPKTPEVELHEEGLECSAILVKLGEEIARRADGEAVLLVTDDPTSPIEMVRWTDRTGHRVLAHRRDGAIHRFLVERRTAAPTH